jgi:hypothetical protein
MILLINIWNALAFDYISLQTTFWFWMVLSIGGVVLNTKNVFLDHNLKDHYKFLFFGQRGNMSCVEFIIITFQFLNHFTIQVHNTGTQATQWDLQVNRFVINTSSQEGLAVFEIGVYHILVQ